MNPFLPGDGTVPDPVLDIPVPETPPADFKTIGQLFAEGQQQSLDNLAAKLNLKCSSGAGANPPSTASTISGIWNGDFLFCWFQKAVSWLMGSLFSLLTWMMQQVFQLFDVAAPQMNALYSATIYGLFGISAGGMSKSPAGLPTQSSDAAPQIASTIAKALAAGTTTSGPGGIQPSSAGADKFLQMAAHMAIEGWLISWVADAASVHELEKFGDLKDTLERSLGVGRLARRALHAPMKIFVEDPYTALLNMTYLPTPLQPGELVRQYMRNHISRDQLQTAMSTHGYASDKVDALIFDQLKQLEPGEIFKGFTTGQYDNDTAIGLMGVAGYDKATAAEWLTLKNQEYTNDLNRKLVEESLTLFKAGKFTQNQYQNVIGNSGLPELERDIWTRLGDLLVLAKTAPVQPEPKRASLAEGLQLLERGIWQLTDYEQLLNYYNYIPSDEFALAQLASDEAVDYAALQLKKQAAEQARAQKEADRLKKAQMMVEDIGVSTGAMETLVYEGLRTIGQYQQYLLNKSVAPDNVQALTQALVIKLAQKTAAAAAKAAAQNKAKTKNVDLAQLETAVKQGLMDITTFTARVKDLGLSDADAGLIAQELTNSISSAATKAKAAADAKATAAQKHVDLSQMERAVRLGIVSTNDYQAFLVAHGFTAEEQGVLMMTLQDQLTADKATAAKKQAAAVKLTTKGINLSQLERMVRAGVKNIGDYTAALASAGYDAADQQSMTQMLQLQMDQDQQDLIVHGHAAALVDQMGVSLADLERAVKLGVVPIATYQDALQRAGVSGPDQQTLVGNLGAQIKTTRAQQATTATVSKQVATSGLSLATLEKDTVSGKLSIEQFQGLLAGYNVPADQVTDTVALVQDEIDNAKAVQALVAQAGARAAAKGLDLTQITAAYKQQVITEDVWRSDVAGLGYDAANVEILFETLAATQAAAAAKSATKSGAAAVTTTAAASAATAGG